MVSEGIRMKKGRTGHANDSYESNIYRHCSYSFQCTNKRHNKYTSVGQVVVRDTTYKDNRKQKTTRRTTSRKTGIYCVHIVSVFTSVDMWKFNLDIFMCTGKE